MTSLNSKFLPCRPTPPERERGEQAGYTPNPRRGQATLSLALLVGGTAILVGVILLAITLSFFNSVVSFRAANQALALAASGAEDAVMRITRNNTFASPGYSVPLGDFSVNVTVAQSGGRATIVSTATVLSARRKVQIIASIHSTTGKVDVVSYEQLSI